MFNEREAAGMNVPVRQVEASLTANAGADNREKARGGIARLESTARERYSPQGQHGPIACTPHRVVYCLQTVSLPKESLVLNPDLRRRVDDVVVRLTNLRDSL